MRMRVQQEKIVRFAAQRMRRALDREGVCVTKEAYRHLVDVVSLPVRGEMYWLPIVQGAIARDYQRALVCEHDDPERTFALERVGDFSLLVCGLFWEQYDRYRQPPNIEYYIRLGRAAYGRIGREPYPELVDKYRRVADALALFGVNYTSNRDQRMVALYAAWKNCRDRRAAHILARIGIQVGESDSKLKH